VFIFSFCASPLSARLQELLDDLCKQNPGSVVMFEWIEAIKEAEEDA
jgi:hypothetical protein